MKPEEDEAFDELARKQGSWGGGFKAKQAMAADKQHWSEEAWRRNNWRCSHGWLRGEQCEICNAAQEPVGQVGVIGSYGFVGHIYDDRKVKTGDKLYTTPPQRQPLTDEEIRQATWATSQNLLYFAAENGMAAKGIDEHVIAVGKAAIEAYIGAKP